MQSPPHEIDIHDAQRPQLASTQTRICGDTDEQRMLWKRFPTMLTTTLDDRRMLDLVGQLLDLLGRKKNLLDARPLADASTPRRVRPHPYCESEHTGEH